MNHSVRSVFSCQGRRLSSRFRRHSAQRLLFAALVGTAPVITTAASPTAPFPPLLPVTEKPASTSLFTKSAKLAAPPTSETNSGKPGAAAQRAAPWPWNPAETFADLFAAAPTPAAGTARTSSPPEIRGTVQSREPSFPAAGSATATTVVTAKRRFDPDLGAAVLVASDTAGGPATGAETPHADPDVLAAAPSLPAAPTASEPDSPTAPVSLVSWLSRSYEEITRSADEFASSSDSVCVTDCRCPTWQVQVDAMFLWQGNVPSRSLYIDTATEQTVLDANQLQTRAAIAPRYSIIYNRDDCRAVEVNYFQAYGFQSTQQLGAPDFPIFNAAGDGAFTIDNVIGLNYDTIGFIQATGAAHIKSFEVNLRQRQGGGMIQWISGFRWLEWGQSLTMIDATYQGSDLTPIGQDVISVATLNNLYGWQFGGDMTLWNAGRWVRINGVGKAGIYYNHQAAQNTYYDNGLDDPTLLGEAKDVASFMGETGINASVSLTRWLSWRLGYSFFWLGGVAVPTRQLTLVDIPNATAMVNATGSVFLQAATTGLEARW